MITITVLYGSPDDIEKFDHHYMEIHVPLTRTLPGLGDVKVTRFLPESDGSLPKYHLMTQLTFADADVMGAAMSSEQGQALAADVANLGIAPTMLIGSTA